MNLISIDVLNELVKTYVDETKIGQPTFTATKEELTGLVNKIFATVMLDGDYSEGLDDLSGFDAAYGNTIEEYFQNFVSPEDYDESGAKVNAPARPSWQKTSYSTRLGRKVLKTTLDYGKYQTAFHDEATYAECVSKITKRLYDSLEIYLNTMRRDLLGKVADRLIGQKSETAFSASSAYTAGTHVAEGVVIADIAASEFSDWSAAVKGGKAVTLDLSTTLAKPTDVETGEAFIKSVKTYVEKFSKPQQGYSYNGNIAGKGPKYKLYINEEIMPSIEVDTLAGAFHDDKLAFGVEVVKVKNFGDSKAYALLADPRGIKLDNAYRAAREQPNADGDFVNYVLHDDEIAFFSPNVMMHAWIAE